MLTVRIISAWPEFKIMRSVYVQRLQTGVRQFVAAAGCVRYE